MTSNPHPNIGDQIRFKTQIGSAHGIVLSLVSASELDVAVLYQDENVQGERIVATGPQGRRVRRYVTILQADVTEIICSGNVSILSQLWAEIARHAALNHYKHTHEPKSTRPFKEGDRIPYAGRVFDEQEVLNLVDASLEFWLTSGRYSNEFEERFAKYLGVRKALLVNSGSSANLIAFMTLTSPKLKERQVRPGDEVITVAAGFPTTINPIIHYGAVPVFIDVEITTGNVDVSLLEAARTEKTKAVMIAHALGNPFNLAAVKEFCEKYKLWLVEDNCDALGAEYVVDGEWRLTGTVGDIGTSSFYPPHHMTMGEGGAVYTQSPVLAKIAASLRDWGRDCWCPAGVDNTCGKRFDWQLGQLPLGYDHKYIYSHFGYNLKATDMQAAIGCAQLDKLPDFVAARRRNFDMLRAELETMSDVFILPEATTNSKPSWFGFLLTLREHAPERRSMIVKALEERGIQTRMLFAGNYTRHPVFDDIRGDLSRYRIHGQLKNSDYIMMNSFWVGVYPGLTPDMLRYIARSIREVVRTDRI